MMVGDLVSGAGKLAESLKTLRFHWDEAKEVWHDAASRDFEEKRLEPLEPIVRLTLDAISRLAEVLDRAQRECG